MQRLTGFLICVLTSVATVSCSSRDSSDDATLTVFAAASLAEVFSDIGNAFEAENPGTRIEFNFSSSSELAAQIIDGAPADVFASADTNNIERVEEGRVSIGVPRIFATNALEILVEADNPFDIRALADLSDPRIVYITCDDSVPIGRYSSEVLTRARVDVVPKSFEANVKSIVNKIVLGEADAGIVYRTDVIAAGSAALGIPIPKESNIVAEYPIVTLGKDPSSLALAFVEFVTTSQAARDILTSHGFGTP